MKMEYELQISWVHVQMPKGGYLVTVYITFKNTIALHVNCIILSI